MAQPTPSQTFRLPAVIPGGRDWPFHCAVREETEAVGLKSIEWVRSLNIYDEKVLQTFWKYRMDVLVGWSYRHADPAHFESCMELMYAYWIIDDLTDEQSPAEVEREVASMKVAYEDPYGVPPADETVLGRVIRSFWKNVLTNCKPPPVMIERYLMNFYKYLDSLPEESRDRETHRLRNTEEHFALRRLTGGLMPSFDFIVMPYNLPDEAENHPIIARMKLAVGDLVITANDIYSWNREQAGGQMRVAHNIVDVVKREHNLTIQEAFDYVEDMYLSIQDQLLEDYRQVPSFSPEVDKVVAFYVEGLLEWVQGNVEFSLASGRYMGDLASDLTVRETGIVEIWPLNAEGLKEKAEQEAREKGVVVPQTMKAESTFVESSHSQLSRLRFPLKMFIFLISLLAAFWTYYFYFRI